MANQQIGINMKFTADTSQAKNQIQTLQTQLTQAITAASKSDFTVNKQLQEAISSAAELKSMLTAATNVNTGNLDLSKFSESLSRSESSLKDYAKQLIELGPAGEQAFMTLAKSVVSAEVPVKRTSALLSDIFITLKNTAKWQISSNIMHGFEGALKSAYGYAQDLNKSLNDIRIVTGASVEDMVRFAEQANKSAKALSTTTTDYTKASLIYYQQGLSDSEVQARTDITIKMANAAGQSAQIVSDQMTAVWNNFDDGSKSLEYYADVMTALGAATASSTDEIATGLEKFAAVSETVGLSYEYATAALATVTDKTRQSADVVGTAFKTMFARIQGLELGETLEDGTTLNDYSEALAKVGVNIKDANGELKDMDNVLNEMAVVWETLNRDEKVALAQKVAGVRQYNQLMSLMENWDAMEMNLEIAFDSEGTLQEQADIYAESWEASRDRVTAAAEDIYNKLLDEDFFIGVNNLLEDVLGGLGHFIDVLGGLPGVLTSIGAIATKVFGNQISNSINNLIYNIGVFTGAAEDSANVLREEMKGAIDVFNKGLEPGSSKALEGEVLKQEIDRTYELQTKVSSLTEEQRQYAQELIKIETQYGKNAVAAQQAAEAASQAQGSQARQMRNSIVDQAAGMSSSDGDKLINDFERTQQYMVKTSQSAVKLKTDIEQALSGKMSGNNIVKILETSIQNLNGKSKTLTGTVTGINEAITKYKKAIAEAGDQTGKKSDATKKLKKELAELGISEEKLHAIIQETAEEVRRSHPGMEVHTQDWIDCGEAAADTARKETEAANAETLYQQRIAETTKKLEQGKLAVQSYGQAFVKGAQGLSSLLFGLNSLKSIFDTLNNNDLSGFEKITTVMTQLTMAIPAIISGFSDLGSAVKLVNEAHKTGNASIFAYLLGLKAENLENQKGEKITLRKALANKLETASTNQNTIAKTINLAITKLLNLETMAFYAALMLIVTIIAGVAIGLNKLTQLYNTDAIAAEKAAKTAEELGKMYDEAADKYQNMIDTMSQYEEAQKSLGALAKGTEEYKEALDKANRAALDLIKNNPGQFQQGVDYDWNDETGALEFKDGVLEQAKTEAADRESAAYSAKILGEAKADQAQAVADKTDFSRDFRGKHGVGDGDLVTRGIVNAITASLGIALAPVTNGLSSMLTAAAFMDTANADEKASEFDTAVSKVVDAYQNNQNVLSGDLAAFTAQMNELGIIDSEVIDALYDNRGELENLGDQTKNAADQYKLATEAAVRELLGDNKTVQNSDNKDEVISKSTDILDKEYQAELNKLKDDGWGTKGISQATGVNDAARDVWSDYVEAVGLKGTSLSNTTGTDDNRIFEYIDAEGETKQVTLEAMKEIVATSKANKKTNETATKLTQVVDTLDTAIKAATDGGENQATVTGLEGAKAGLLSGNFTDFSGAELSTLMGIDPETYIKELFGSEYETILQELGFKNAEEYINTFSQGLANAKGILEEALASLGEDSPLVGLAENASAAAVQNIVNQSQRAEGLKEGGGAKFESNINSIIGTVDKADQGAAFEALANIDWSQLSAPEEAIEALGRLGINSKETEEKIIELTGSMRELNGANLNDLNTALDSDIDVTEYENLAKHIQDVADETEDLSDDLKYNEKAAKKTAEAILRFDKAIQKVDENYDDWKHTLDSGSLQDQAEVVGELKDAYADMLDIDMDSLSDDFVKNADNLELMKKAANGSEEAYKELQQLAGEDILMQIGLDKSQYETDLADINDLALEAEGLGLADIEAGASLNNEDFLNGLTEIVNQAGMTAQEATDYLASMGVDAEIEEVESTSTDTSNFGGAAPVFEWQEKTFSIPILGEQTIRIPKINWKAFTVPSESEKTTTATGIKVTSANKSSGGGIKHKHSKSGGGTGGAGKKGGGGGGSAPKPAETVKKTKKSDVVDRYKEVTDSLDENTRALDKANKKADQLYGPGRIKWLQKANELIKEQNTLLKQQQTEAKKNLMNDKKDLNAAAKAAGLDFSYDNSGNITNYTTEMEKLFNELAQAENKINSFSTKDQQDKFKESTLQPIQDKIDALKEALAQYEETRELLQDLQEQYKDNLVQLFNNDLEIVTIAVELNLDAAESGLEWIEYQLKKIEDQAFSTAEAMALISEKLPKLQSRQENNEWRKEQTLNTLVEHGYFTDKDVNNFNAGNMEAINWTKIPESAMNELLAYREELYNINEQYMELRDTINGSVIEAFEQWSESMQEQMELFDHYDAVITSYQNIADLGGKRLGISDEDLIEYEQERINNANNRLTGSKSYYDQAVTHRNDIAAQLELAEKRYKDYEVAGNTDGMEAEAINIAAWKESLKVAEEEVRSTEEQFLEDWQSALEASRDAFLKETEIEMKALEEQMAGTYGTIEEMQKEFDKKQEISERYLEDYERMYELTKLNRELTKKMDETSNVKAKQELAKLQEEILGYQEEGRKMSDYDLEYLQKRYDLKLAEIAMEEAQNAKTQVRLTRDSEGNYSYTYTADEDSMAESQQAYEDKLYEITDLSNKHIEEQTSLLLSTQQEYLDALNEIHQKAADRQYATTEEYQKALDECTAYYTEKMRYHGGEIDKATLNNAVVYAEDYATYEEYIGRKLTEDEKLQRQMDANIIKAKADVEKLQIEKQAALDEIHRLNAEGYYATDKEYQDALAKVEEDYGKRITKAEEKVTTSVANRVKVYGEDSNAYSLETAKKVAAEEGLVTSVKKYLPELKDAHGSVTGYVKTAVEAIGDAKKGTGHLGTLSASYKALETNIDTTMTNAGSSVKGFKDDIKKKLITDKDSVKNKSKETADSIKTIGDASKNLTNTISSVTTWQKSYSKEIQKAITINEKFIKSINDAEAAAAKQAKSLAGEKDDGKCKKCGKKPCQCKPDGNDGNDDGDDKKRTQGDKRGVALAIWNGNHHWGTGETRKKRLEEKGFNYNEIQALVNSTNSNGDWYNRYKSEGVSKDLSKYKYTAYDTGGYTGDWGSEGKWALLHEKELILNKEDTENMLNIVSMVRDLVSVLDIQAYQASLAQLQASQLNSMSNKQDLFEQTVTIHAEFPDAVYATEIEAALSNLVNNASQYANRKY